MPRTKYDLPDRPPVPMRMFALMAAIPLLVLAIVYVAGWESTPLVVVLLFLVVFAVVAAGVAGVLKSTPAAPPGRNEVARDERGAP